MQKHCLPAAALLLGSSPLYATDDTVAPIIVTATRTAEAADETLAPVTVITRKEIESQQVVSVQDLLRGVPGVSIANSGGLGKVTSVFLRGTESDHVLVLIDGIKVGSATLGTTSFEHIPIDQIERIEIVRGPHSSLYGSEAIGGVIQIFTRKGGGAPTPYLRIGGGSHQTDKIAGGVTGGGTRGWYNASVDGLDSNGFDACRGEPATGGCSTREPDDDGYRNRSGALRAGYRFANGVEVDVHTLHARADTNFDGTFVNESEFVQRIVGSKLRFSPTNIWELTLVAGESRDELDSFLNGVFKSRFDTERDTVSFQNDVTLGENHLFTVGFDHQDDRVSTTAFALSSRDNEGLFAQYQTAFGGHNVQLSVRNDDNEQFGRSTTGNLAWGYGFGDEMRLILSYGSAFKAPTFNELFFPEFGNPGLDPEESRSAEVALRGKAHWGNWSLNVYQTTVNDLIASDPNTSAAANIEEVRIRGLEVVVATQLSQWDIKTSVTLLDPENRTSGPNRGNVLPRRAEHTLRVNLERSFRRLALGVTLFGEGRRFDDLANTRRLAGYATVDMRAEYQLHKHWILQARLGNLFDKDYETAEFFNQDGRNFFLTLWYRPKRTQHST